MLVGLPTAGVASKAKYKVLYAFCHEDAACNDGQYPLGRVARAADGTIYGAAAAGGATSLGAIYAVKPNGTETVIYNFCSQAACADGGNPNDLIIDAQGNLYGVAGSGGAHGQGTVFKLARGRHHSWKFQVLHDFCAKSNCKDGAFPWGGVTYAGRDAGAPYDGQSPLYGITTQGGVNGQGSAYRLSFSAGDRKTRFEVLYSFCSKQSCTDGTMPYSGLSVDGSGNVYGTAAGGDANSDGVVYQLAPGSDGYVETVIYTFCQLTDCADGWGPYGVTSDGHGNLIGTTAAGGASDLGTVYKLSANGGTWSWSLLHSFCADGGTCSDGSRPNGPVAVDANGDIFGTTSDGGVLPYTAGVVFKLHGTHETVLHPFCSDDTCTDGDGADSNAVIDVDGTLYGTAEVGGTPAGGGVLFQVSNP